MGLILGDLEKAGVEAFNTMTRKLNAIDESAVKEIVAEGRAAVKKLNEVVTLLHAEVTALKAIRERLFHP